MLGSMRTFARTGLYGAAYKIYEGLHVRTRSRCRRCSRRGSRRCSRPIARRHRRVALGGITGSTALGMAVALVAFIIATPLLVLSLRPELRGRDNAVPPAVHRPAGRLRDLDPSRDCDLGRSANACCSRPAHRPRCERRVQPVHDPALRPEWRRLCDRGRRNREHGRSCLWLACNAVKRTRASLFVLLFVVRSHISIRRAAGTRTHASTSSVPSRTSTR